jgi:malate dehydrogenase
MAVYSDGIEEGLIYSYPITCKCGEWTIVSGLVNSDFITSKMKASEADLQESPRFVLTCFNFYVNYIV